MISTGNVAYCLGMNPKKLHRWYKEVLSGYQQALESGEIGQHDLPVRDPKYGEYDLVRVPVYKPQNMGLQMAIDEKHIDGTAYTILSNRVSGKIALMADTLIVKDLYAILRSYDNCMQVRSITRDMASNYDWLCRQAFMNAYHVIDKFHVIKNALDDLQAIRIRYRHEELAMKRQHPDQYQEQLLDNGDTVLQLLARSRGLLFKLPDQWTYSQKNRAQVLFERYHDLRQAYKQILKLRKWYERTPTATKQSKTLKLNAWLDETKALNIYEMNNLCQLFNNHKGHIINFFIKGETNAKAESLNSQLQRFIHVNYGARNTDYFLYRINRYLS